jgi:hypothetical protein
VSVRMHGGAVELEPAPETVGAGAEA